MKVKTFVLPVMSSDSSEDELNKFLRSHRVLQIERHFSSENGGFWAVLDNKFKHLPILQETKDLVRGLSLSSEEMEDERTKYILGYK